MKFEKILFHTRFREMALSALEALLDLTKVGLKEVVLVHVIPREKVAFVPYGGYMKEKETHIKKKARDRFEKWQAVLEKKRSSQQDLYSGGHTKCSDSGYRHEGKG